MSRNRDIPYLLFETEEDLVSVFLLIPTETMPMSVVIGV